MGRRVARQVGAGRCLGQPGSTERQGPPGSLVHWFIAWLVGRGHSEPGGSDGGIRRRDAAHHQPLNPDM